MNNSGVIEFYDNILIDGSLNFDTTYSLVVCSNEILNLK